MSLPKKVRVESVLDRTMGRELLEDELAVICGGSKGEIDPAAGMGPLDPSGFSPLTNLLTGPKSANAKGAAPDGAPDLGPLSNLTGGLFSKLF